MAIVRASNLLPSFALVGKRCKSTLVMQFPQVVSCKNGWVRNRDRDPMKLVCCPCMLSAKRASGSSARIARRTGILKPENQPHWLGQLPSTMRSRRVQTEDVAPSDSSLDLALNSFEAEVRKSDDKLQLSSAVALLALHTDPSIDLASSVFQPLEDLRGGFRERVALLDAVAGPLAPVARQEALAAALCSYLTAEGFRGCGRSAQEYYRPENSLLNVVLRTKEAIPSTLAVLYLDVGAANGLELFGANFPGHFMLGFGRGTEAGLIDTFGGRSASAAEANAVLGELFGRPVCLDPAWSWKLRIPKVSILRRMVLNLQNVYRKRNDAKLAGNVAKFARILDRVLSPASAPL
eukprot:TRINITY_DN46482_c0_g1_i1.p1 TRINITY_DN46482_c0_g1~~TRINITY_DN46482_c0_g1_i1.p1  ORF type:complete len:350 (-),score=50.01 TRINITY_DN46482_c0_g1_i1:45-1094(-)